MNICDYVHTYENKSRQLQYRPILPPIRKFYSMNDIQLNWDKIHSFEGEKEKQAEDRPYTHSEIQTLIQKTSPRNRAIIFLMASSGLRVGAVPLLRIKDLEPIDPYSIYKINVYTKSKKSRYSSYCSTECRKEIDSYLEWRKRWGERLQDNSPVFRREYNTEGKIQVRPITDKAIQNFMYILARVIPPLSTNVTVRSSASIVVTARDGIAACRYGSRRRRLPCMRRLTLGIAAAIALTAGDVAAAAPAARTSPPPTPAS